MRTKAPALLKRLEVWLVKAVWRWQRQQASRLGVKGKLKGGGVCFWQYFNSRLQVAPHLHLVVPEALWTEQGHLVEVPGPSDDDVMAILQRVLRMAKKVWPEEDFWAEDEYEALQQQAAQPELPLGDARAPRPRKPLVAVVDNFSLHAGTLVHGNDREGLQRLARYGARGPIAESRLERLDDGHYRYASKKGCITLTAAELVRKLLALTPPPRRHLTSWHGVFAPNAKLRRPLTTPATAPTPPPKRSKKPKPAKRPRIDWASLHQHTFKVDVFKCPHCGGRRRVRAVYDTRTKAEARLAELGLFPDTSPPPLPFPTAPPPFVLAA